MSTLTYAPRLSKLALQALIEDLRLDGEADPKPERLEGELWSDWRDRLEAWRVRAGTRDGLRGAIYAAILSGDERTRGVAHHFKDPSPWASDKQSFAAMVRAAMGLFGKGLKDLSGESYAKVTFDAPFELADGKLTVRISKDEVCQKVKTGKTELVEESKYTTIDSSAVQNERQARAILKKIREGKVTIELHQRVKVRKDVEVWDCAESTVL